MDCSSPSEKQHENAPKQEKAAADNTGKKAAHMEKFKEAVMKLLITSPKTPLSEGQKAVLQEKVSQCISLLHTPDHPPYAWMIERALQELNEKGGSSEDSISKFIRKEYNDLPWSHFTMLKYHLSRLYESGELVLTSGQRYLLPAANSDRKIRAKSRRKSVKRKKGWDRDITQSKRRKKVARKKNMLHKGDEVLFSLQKDNVTSNEIYEERECMVQGNKQPKLKGNDIAMLCSQQKYQITSKEVHKQEVCMLEGNKQQMLKSDEVEMLSSQQKHCGASKYVNEEVDCVMEGSEQQKSEVEVRPGLVNLSVAEDKGANCNSDVSSSSTSSLLITDSVNNLLKLGMQQPTGEPIVGTIDSASPDAQLALGWKQLKDNRTKLATPERPLGFEGVTFKGSSQFQPQTAVSYNFQVHIEQLNQNHAHDFSDTGVKSSETEIIDIEKSLYTDRTQRYMQRLERLSGDKTFLLRSAELQDGNPPEDRDLDKGQTSVEHQRQKKVAQGNQTSRVLRSEVRKQGLSKSETSTTLLASHDHHERQKPEFQNHQGMLPEEKPDAEVTDGLTLRMREATDDLALKGSKSKPSKGVIGDKLLPKHDLKKQQLGFRGRGRPPKASMPAKAIPGRPIIVDIAPLNDQEQPHHAQPPLENLDITLAEMLVLKSIDNPQLEQQLDKPRRGRPPQPKGYASTVVKSCLKHKTTYRGRGRPRLTDIRHY